MTNTPRSIIQLLVMDGSSAMRGTISKYCESKPSIHIAGSVHNQTGAIHWLTHNKADIAIISYEDGPGNDAEFIALIKQMCPTMHVLLMHPDIDVLSTNVELLLAQGVSDILPRPSLRDANSKINFFAQLEHHLTQFFSISHPATPIETIEQAPIQYPTTPPEILAIGSSTGGPQALTTLFREIGDQLSHIPILITQHMPAQFTDTLAKHISEACGQPTTAPKQTTQLEAGHIYVAPGDYHMRVFIENSKHVIRLNKDAPINYCRPAVDAMISSLTPLYSRKLLITMLTGMGQDGLASSIAAKDAGATIIAQDKESSVVWGMPGAVSKANICSAILPLDSIAPYLIKSFQPGASS